MREKVFFSLFLKHYLEAVSFLIKKNVKWYLKNEHWNNWENREGYLTVSHEKI